MNDFYITLPSNVKNDFYNNTIANYRTKLATNLKLDDKWRVGIASISYTNSWDVKSEYAGFRFSYQHIYFTDYKDESFENIDLTEFVKVEDIITEMNERIENYEKRKNVRLPHFQINKMTNRVEFKPVFVKNAMIFPHLSDNLATVLGFDNQRMDAYITKKHNEYRAEWESLTLSQKWNSFYTFHVKEPEESDYTYISDNPYNILPTFSTLYVYCDLVKHNFVGDSYTQLMRIVEVPPNSKFRDQILFNYSNIHYMPLQLTEFDTIEIHIKDDLNQSIPFLFGRVIITLHFKRF